ncbi:MAG: LysR family transcriptional regulator [Rhodobacteraceae bacterium]|nr:LysR family transcriptional regulator [Paracoccaceae bacterium]
MPPSIVNLQTDLLRTFVSIVDLGSFTKAGLALGRTQPAISLQMRRLEDVVGRPLIRQEGRSFRLTADGEMLLSYARDILRLNDEAATYFSRTRFSGPLRVGLPSDYAVAFLQGIVIEYARINPDVALELRCDLSGRILERMYADQLDLVIAMVEPGRTQYMSRAWIERPIWVGTDTGVIDVAQGVAIAAHPDGCAYRARMIHALDAAVIRWRVSYTGLGISGLQNAVLNGLGISALTRHTLLPGMRMLGAADGLPPLDDIRVGLFYKHSRLSSAGIGLVNQITGRLDAAGASGDPTRTLGELRIA